MTIRSQIVSGVAAVALVGAAQTARADNNFPRNLRVDVQLNAAQDGRGETSDFNTYRSQSVSLSAPDRMSFTRDNGAALPQMKAEVQLSAAQDGRGDTGASYSTHARTQSLSTSREIPGASRDQRMAQPQSLRASQNQRAIPLTKQVQQKLPIKSDISNRVELAHDGDEADTSIDQPKARTAKKARSAPSASVVRMMKTQFQLEAGSSGDHSDEQ